MRDSLFIRLGPSPTAPVEWLRMAGDPGGESSLPMSGTLQQAAEDAARCRIIVFVPGVDVLLSSAAIPSRNRQRMISAIPYILEEQLATDVDNLHFAIGQRQEDGAVCTAIVDRARIDAWIAQLAEAGIEPEFILPDILAVPLTQDGWSVLREHTGSLVRTAVQRGFAVDSENLIASLQLALAEAADKPPVQLTIIDCTGATEDALSSFDTTSGWGDDELESLDDIQISGMDEDIETDALDDETPADESTISRAASLSETSTASPGLDAAPIPAEFTNLGIEVNYLADPRDPLEVLAASFDAKTAINLLQGRYSRREQLGKLIRPWIPAAAMLMVLLVISLATTVSDYVRLSNENDQLASSIEKVFHDTCPNVRRIVNARVQMKQCLQESGSGALAGGQGFLEMLAAIGQPLNQAQGLELRRVTYRDGRLDLALIIGDLQGLDELKQRIAEATGLTVEIQSATSRDNKVDARLQLKGAES